MKRILLTSSGLTASLEKVFFTQVNKKPDKIKIIVVPSASTVNDGAREGISMGIISLLAMGIRVENILFYDLNHLLSAGYIRTYSSGIDISRIPQQMRLLTENELEGYDAILFLGGHADVLLNEIKRTGFQIPLIQGVNHGLFYIGVSAGSMVAAGNFPNSLGFLGNSIIPHCEVGAQCGAIIENTEVYLADGQAVWITDEGIRIIE